MQQLPQPKPTRRASHVQHTHLFAKVIVRTHAVAQLETHDEEGGGGGAAHPQVYEQAHAVVCGDAKCNEEKHAREEPALQIRVREGVRE